MKKGFIFNQNKCVACGACSAACILENGWDVMPRVIYRFNPEALSGIPVINLSMACNHCEEAVCMNGCPAKAYTRDIFSGAVIIDEKKCIGCRYCQWICPYDAPKLNIASKIINKCDLCMSAHPETVSPACSSGCPTGALTFGEISEFDVNPVPDWLPDKSLNPSMRITGKHDKTGPRIIAGNRFSDKHNEKGEPKQFINKELSLVLFTFLTTVSAALSVSYLTKSGTQALFLPLIIVAAAGIISIFHLKSPFSAWRSFINIKSSPLSREIAAFSFYTAALISAFLTGVPWLFMVSALAGIILLIFIDNVYYYADNRKYLFFHSGQTFVSGLLMISFLSGGVIPFIFIGILKILSVFFTGSLSAGSKKVQVLRFLRLAFLIIAGSAFISGLSFDYIIINSLFFAGELIDRFLFYYDFSPLNIKQLTNSKIYINEEKRG